MPILDYVRQTATDIHVTYADMPAATEVVFVNTMSNAQTPSGSNALSNGGAGSATIPIVSSLGAGQYYLLAQGQANKQYLAQTVKFYLTGASEGFLARFMRFFGIAPRGA